MSEHTTGTPVAITPDLDINNGEITTTSQQIAEHFGKAHRYVLQAIRRLECSQDFRLRNFVQSSYMNEQGKKQPRYRLTRDGFVFLAMGFTGKDAAQWKEAYITAFNKMENALLNETMRRTIPATLYEQALQIETREAKSFALAQAGSQAMLLRKSEKKELVEMVDLMREAIQLRLALGMGSYA